MRQPSLLILLSTYNGELYLKELLDSLLAQNYRNINILIRDDGSTDSTCDIIQKFCQKHNNISFIKGKNLGAAQSFMELLKIAPNSDYYAFADQDDVWLPEKISNGIECIKRNNSDLYHSNYILTDKNLNVLFSSNKPIVNTIGEAAVLYPCTGCTMIISQKLRNIVNTYNPDYLVMHDSWIFKIAMAVSDSVIFDDHSYIYYRQHENNVLGGINQNVVKRFIARFRSLLHPSNSRYKEIRELNKGFGYLMKSTNRKIVADLANYNSCSFKGRLKIAFDKNYITVLSSKNLLFKLSILTKSF